jgi:UDP-N-acetyl-D-mannosaminuronic acid dehydrogenase
MIPLDFAHGRAKFVSKASASVCIVGGCGHVGLPFGIALCLGGAKVTLLDISQTRVEQVRAGQMPFMEQGGEEALPEALATGRLLATHDAAAISQHDTVVVTVGTPVDEFLDPSVRSFDEALDAVIARMHDGQLLVLRSTVFPGVTERLARRVAEKGLHIDIAYCPERIAQGFALDELARLPQIIGPMGSSAARRATQLFSLLGVKIVEVQPVEAELSKLFANAYRYINFAIANQFYIIANKFGADFDRVHKAVTQDYPRMSGFAKAGFAAGPCLFKDTMQLGAFNHNAFGLGQAAMTVNEGMPAVLVEIAKTKLDLTNSTAAILGMAFKGNSDDDRSSLAYKLRKLLHLNCRRVICTDPYIQNPGFCSLEAALAEADVIFLGAPHAEYRGLKLDKPVFDLFGFIQSEQPLRLAKPIAAAA